MKKRLIYLWLILITQLRPVLAYIDPGSGSMIATSAWSVILTVLGIIGTFFCKNLF